MIRPDYANNKWASVPTPRSDRLSDRLGVALACIVGLLWLVYCASSGK